MRRFLIPSLIFHGLLLVAIAKIPFDRPPEEIPISVELIPLEEITPPSEIPPPPPVATVQTPPARPEPKIDLSPPPPNMPAPEPGSPAAPSTHPAAPAGKIDTGGEKTARDRPVPEGEGLEPPPPDESDRRRKDEFALYDRKIIEKYGRGEDADKPGEQDDEITLDTEEFALLTYRHRLARRMEAGMGFPRYSIRSSILRIDPFIRLVIRRDGSLGDVELLRTFGSPSRDRSALVAVRRLVPFPPLPSDWPSDEYTVFLEFEPR